MKKRWLAVPLVAGALAIAVLTAGVINIGSASAQEADTEERTSVRQMFIDKVAGFLDRTPDEVQGAFQQAREEIHDERLDAKFDSLIAAGTITEQDKADILEWLDDKPEGLPGHGIIGKHGRGFGMGGMIAERLMRAVENGVLSQEEVDEILTWYEARPAIVDELPGVLMDGRGGKGRMHGFFKGPRGGVYEFRGQFRGRFQPPAGGNGESVPQTTAPSDAISF